MGEKMVIVRSSQSGVWFGEETDREVTESGLLVIGMRNARRLWRWQGATECAGIARHGCKSDKMSAPVNVTVGGVCEVVHCHEDAVSVLRQIEEWKP